MSKTSTIVTVVVVIVVIVAAGGYYYWHTRTVAAAAQAAATYPTQAPAALPAGNDTSDAGLAKDATAVDASLQQVNADNTSASQSVDAHQAP